MQQEKASLGAALGVILDAFETGGLRPGFRAHIRSGSASGEVSVVDSPDDPGVDILLVRLPIMRVPDADADAFYRRLLLLDAGFLGRAAFCLMPDDTVALCAGRNVRDLELDELVDLILWTAEQADHVDDLLLTEFGYRYRVVGPEDTGTAP